MAAIALKRGRPVEPPADPPVPTAFPDSTPLSNAAYLDACDRAEAAIRSLCTGVSDLQAWKRAVVTQHALPLNALSKLLVTVSQITRAKTDLVSTMASALQVTRLFAHNLVHDEQIRRLDAITLRRATERDMAKLMALESERKLRAALMQIVRMRDQHKEFRWIRLTQKLLLRNEKKSGLKKLRSTREAVKRARMVASMRQGGDAAGDGGASVGRAPSSAAAAAAVAMTAARGGSSAGEPTSRAAADNPLSLTARIAGAAAAAAGGTTSGRLSAGAALIQSVERPASVQFYAASAVDADNAAVEAIVGASAMRTAAASAAAAAASAAAARTQDASSHTGQSSAAVVGAALPAHGPAGVGGAAAAPARHADAATGGRRVSAARNSAAADRRRSSARGSVADAKLAAALATARAEIVEQGLAQAKRLEDVKEAYERRITILETRLVRALMSVKDPAAFRGGMPLPPGPGAAAAAGAKGGATAGSGRPTDTSRDASAHEASSGAAPGPADATTGAVATARAAQPHAPRRPARDGAVGTGGGGDGAARLPRPARPGVGGRGAAAARGQGVGASAPSGAADDVVAAGTDSEGAARARRAASSESGGRVPGRASGGSGARDPTPGGSSGGGGRGASTATRGSGIAAAPPAPRTSSTGEGGGTSTASQGRGGGTAQRVDMWVAGEDDERAPSVEFDASFEADAGGDAAAPASPPGGDGVGEWRTGGLRGQRAPSSGPDVSEIWAADDHGGDVYDGASYDRSDGMWRVGGAAGGSAPPSRSGAHAAGDAAAAAAAAAADDEYSDEDLLFEAPPDGGAGAAPPSGMPGRGATTTTGSGGDRPVLVLPSSFVPTLPAKRSAAARGARPAVPLGSPPPVTERLDRDGVRIVDFSSRVMHSAR